jgi:hypothetical protein
MISLLFLLLYGLEIWFESYLFYHVLDVKHQPFRQTFLDILAVNVISLVLMLLFLGPVIRSIMSFDNMNGYALRNASIVIPEKLVTLGLASVAFDAVLTGFWYYRRYPGQDTLLIAFKACVMNLPTLVLTLVFWVFARIMGEALRWMGLL